MARICVEHSIGLLQLDQYLLCGSRWLEITQQSSRRVMEGQCFHAANFWHADELTERSRMVLTASLSTSLKPMIAT
jgi:hypothetical protein